MSVVTTSDAEAAPVAERDDADAPRRGRPRSAGVDEKLLTAVLDLASEVGISQMSMDDVAQRAEASKASIYRRWRSKEDLVLDAMRRAMLPFEVNDTGSLRTDVEEYLRELADRMTNSQTSDMLPHLMEVAVRDEALRASLDEYVQSRRAPLEVILRSAMERGDLAADTDVDTLLDALIGPLTYRRFLTHSPLDEAFLQRLIRVVLPAI